MTYILLTIIPLLIILSFDVFIGEKYMFKKGFWEVVGIFMVCMVLFDSYLTGLPIVVYNAHAISGIMIGTIPIEDFFYGFALILTVFSIPSLMKFSWKDWRMVMFSSRPFSWVNTAYPAGLAIFLARGTFILEDILCVVFFLLPYNLLVYGINDIYDYETDIKNPRKASIEGAILPKKLHKLMLWVSTGCALIFFPGFLRSNVLFLSYLSAIFLAIAYSVPPIRTKIKPGLDSITSSLHFVLPAMIGFLWGGGEGIIRIEFLSFFFWGIASHMLGALPDIIPDKKAGMKTIATVLGETKTSFAIFCFYAISAVLLLLQGKDYFLIGSVIGGYTVFPIWSLLDRTMISGLFRKFMYFNLVTGFIITITVILHFIR